jgi:hypothetical protein
MIQPPPNYISFEAPKERLAWQEDAGHPGEPQHPSQPVRQTMAPPILGQAALEALPHLAGGSVVQTDRNRREDCHAGMSECCT